LDYWCANTDESRVPPYDFKDPRLETDRADVPLDTSASAVVAEQLARLAVTSRRTASEVQVTRALAPVIDGLLKHLTGMGNATTPTRERGILLDGCFNEPKGYATRSELIWGTAYLLFALYYLKTGRVVE
jgi:hypothetical protein